MGDIDQVASFDICLFEFCLPGDFSDTIEKIDQGQATLWESSLCD